MASDESDEEFYDAEEDSFTSGNTNASESLTSSSFVDNGEYEKDRSVLPTNISADVDTIVEFSNTDNVVVVVDKEPLRQENNVLGHEENAIVFKDDLRETNGGDVLSKTREIVSDINDVNGHDNHPSEERKQTDYQLEMIAKESPKELHIVDEISATEITDKTFKTSSNFAITTLTTQISDSSLNSDQPFVNSLTQTDECGPPPIPPPRRKRKKKLEALAAAQAQTEAKTDPVMSLSSGVVSGGNVTDDSSFQHSSSQADVLDPLIQKDTQDPNEPELDLFGDPLKMVLEEPEPPTDADIVIKLDSNTLDMHNVLDRAKTFSTQVVSENTFEMMRTKSASVNSLGGTGSSKSGSFVSVNSGSHNGTSVIYKSGSHHSLGSAEVHKTESLYRTSSFSGRALSDAEILEQVTVTNLDTGESVPLSQAEDTLPQCTNPLTLQIMRLTSEYSSNPDVAQLSDAEDHTDGGEGKAKTIKKKTKKLKSFIGKTVHKIKQKAEEERHKKAQKAEDSGSSDDESAPGTPYIKIKSSHKGPVEFERLRLVQELSDQHVGAVWTMKFSCCGRLLATAGQDNLVRVWVLKKAYRHFEELRSRYSKADIERPSSPTISEDSVEALITESEPQDVDEIGGIQGAMAAAATAELDDSGPFCDEPFCTYEGHTGDVLDLSWSKNYFLLSSSMDKTVRLWHISRRECLCCFQHIDFVTAITFHPRDDRYFLSGSLDGKIRLWNIPDKKVALWNEVEGSGSNLITAANFCINGKFAVVGTYDGRCIFYVTESLKYHTQIHVRSSRKKHAKGRKISGIEAMPGEDKVLITSNDSRIRLYDLKDHSLYCKYKGYTNTSSQIKGTFSPSGQYIICGSEDRYVYIWRTHHGVQSSRRDRNDFYESFSAHDAVVTTAIFAPIPSTIIPDGVESSGEEYEVIVTADWLGKIKLFVNR